MTTTPIANATASSSMSILTVLMILMFLTGNCESCNSHNRDYLGDTIDAVGGAS